GGARRFWTITFPPGAIGKRSSVSIPPSLRVSMRCGCGPVRLARRPSRPKKGAQAAGGPMKIATFNINGVKARLNALIEWLDEDKADVVLLQEIKSVDEGFPREVLED